MRAAGTLFGWAFMKSVEEGAATETYVASHPDLVGVNGFYFADCEVNDGETPHMQDDAMARKLWEVSENLTRDYLPVPTRRA
jgi:WW domain-containing oxidoreductase